MNFFKDSYPKCNVHAFHKFIGVVRYLKKVFHGGSSLFWTETGVVSKNFGENHIVHSDIQPHAPPHGASVVYRIFSWLIGVYTERGGCMCGCAECVCVQAEVHEAVYVRCGWASA